VCPCAKKAQQEGFEVVGWINKMNLLEKTNADKLILDSVEKFDEVCKKTEYPKIKSLVITEDLQINDFGDLFSTFVGNLRFPNLRNLDLQCGVRDYSFLDWLGNHDLIEKLTLNALPERDIDQKMILDIEEPMKNLKEINFHIEEDIWKIFVNNCQCFPHLESVSFNLFDDEYIESFDLLKFPNLKKVKLDNGTNFLEASDSEFHEPMFMDHLSELEYLEEIDYLVLFEIETLKKFKNLKHIGTLSVPNKSTDKEYIEATKGIIIDDNVLDWKIVEN